ncbi:hypothetical protein HOC80_03915 [archaeon]|jgi:hypothetical protein|nr:hypothetical protein [archaeon]MBT4417221.1 hypothetical protein [archaeon]
MKKVALILAFMVLCSLVVSAEEGKSGSYIGKLKVEKIMTGGPTDNDASTWDNNYVKDMEFGDFDGDSDDELAFSISESDELDKGVFVVDYSPSEMFGSGIKSGSGERNFEEILSTGSSWDDGVYAVDIVFGEIDNRQAGEELLITVFTNENDRVRVYSGGQGGFLGSIVDLNDGYSTSVSSGDLEGDGDEEIIVGMSTSLNTVGDWFVYDYGSAEEDLLFCGGAPTSKTNECTSTGVEFSNYYTSKIATGDFSRSTGNDEFALIKTSAEGNKVVVLQGSTEDDIDEICEINSEGDFLDIAFGGEGWSNPILGVVTSDVSDSLNFYYEASGKCFEYYGGAFTFDFGEGWFANGVEFGDIDGDNIDEFIVTVDYLDWSSSHPRWYAYDFSENNLELMFCGGGSSSYDCMITDDEIPSYPSAVATGDVDGDGKDEFAIGTRAEMGDRWFVYSYDPDASIIEDKGIESLDLAPIFTIEPTLQTPACSDGVDNDGDGGYDFTGGCFDGEIMVEPLECEVDLLSCNEYCKINYDAYYVNGDPGCESNDDTTEMNRCGDRRDNDWDFTADFTGGCDVDHDYAIDYVCGCDLDQNGWIDPLTETMQKELCNGKYGCAGLPPITTHYVVNYTLDCEILEGRYLLPDPDCSDPSDDSERDEGYQEYRNIEEEMENQAEADSVYCTPGDTFDAGDGCNTCTCLPSGLVADASCTIISCGDYTPPPMAAAENPDDSMWIKFLKWFGLIA